MSRKCSNKPDLLLFMGNRHLWQSTYMPTLPTNKYCHFLVARAYGDHIKWKRQYKENIRVYVLPNNKKALVLFVADDWSPPSKDFIEIVDKGPSNLLIHERTKIFKTLKAARKRYIRNGIVFGILGTTVAVVGATYLWSRDIGLREMGWGYKRTATNI